MDIVFDNLPPKFIYVPASDLSFDTIPLDRTVCCLLPSPLNMPDSNSAMEAVTATENIMCHTALTYVIGTFLLET